MQDFQEGGIELLGYGDCFCATWHIPYVYVFLWRVESKINIVNFVCGRPCPTNPPIKYKYKGVGVDPAFVYNLANMLSDVFAKERRKIIWFFIRKKMYFVCLSSCIIWWHISDIFIIHTDQPSFIKCGLKNSEKTKFTSSNVIYLHNVQRLYMTYRPQGRIQENG